MNNIYYLNQDNLPLLPCPHDCMIKQITKQNNQLIFYFEEDISKYDSIKYLNKDAKSLIIRFNLIDDFDIYKFNKKRLFIKPNYTRLNPNNIYNLTNNHTEYLYNYIGYESLIIELSSNFTSYILSLRCDYIEYEWIY